MIKFINILIKISLIFFLSYLIFYTSSKFKKLHVNNISFVFDNDESNSFITNGDLLNIINEIIDYRNMKLSDLSLNIIETELKKNKFIKSAEVYLLPNGNLEVYVAQKEPIMRIVNEKSSYYLDEKGIRFPLSTNFTENVPIVTGLTDSSNIFYLVKLISLISNNSFLKSQIVQVNFNQNNEIELIPRVGQNKILFGDFSEMNEKLNKLIIFYRKGVHQIGWDKHSLINLKYKQQIVCVKR